MQPKPVIRGRAWFGPDGQQPWEFRLLVDPDTRARNTIDWSALLPGERWAGWLSLDPQRQTMTIDPLGGHPD
ncbi:hypothetical protein ABT369_16915 [Dactylosporangium sp. NPDC000244]|uniref:hypothetical protein n=1 Tax=Dactylosporangium sp. NPDC000244 TaxID=3154365 RepID=UPI00331E5E1F